MNALIVLGGTAPSASLLRACAKVSQLCIAADSGLAAYDSAGILPDLIIGDMDSVAPELLHRYEKTATVRFPVMKDDTDAVCALDRACQSGADHVLILGALGGRMDHAMANLMLLIRSNRKGISAEILTETMRIGYVDGEAILLGQKGETVSFLPFGYAECVSLRGFLYPLEKRALTNEHPLGISNVITEDVATVRLERGDLLMFQQTDTLHYLRQWDACGSAPDTNGDHC